MDRLIFTTLSTAAAEEAIYHDDEYDDEYDDDYDDDLGPEEHRLLRRRRQRRRHRQRERRARRLLASGLEPWQVRKLEEDVRRSERVLRRRPPLPPAFTMAGLVFSCVGVLGVTSGAFFTGWVGWAVLIAGAVILMLDALLICQEDHEHRRAEETRADAEETQARVRTVLERTGNADLLPLQDW